MEYGIHHSKNNCRYLSCLLSLEIFSIILVTGAALNPGLLVANLAEPLINRELIDETVSFLISFNNFCFFIWLFNISLDKLDDL